jgi:SlyX protein
MPDKAMDERLEDIEMRLAFLDDAVAGLTDADAMQARRLLGLEQAVQALRTELASVRTALGHDAHAEPPPPHY